MLELTVLEPAPALKSWRNCVLREIEEQFAILERIPTEKLICSCLYWESTSERSFLRLGQVEKFLTGGKVLFGRSILLGRILQVKNHHVLTGVITENMYPTKSTALL